MGLIALYLFTALAIIWIKFGFVYAAIGWLSFAALHGAIKYYAAQLSRIVWRAARKN
jgi:cell division protein FtsB